MAEKDDLQNLEADLGLLQHRFLRGLSSGLPDTMPAPGIALERLRLSNDAKLSKSNIHTVHFAYGISTA